MSVRGEQVLSDLVMFTFNFTNMAGTAPYVPACPQTLAAAFFRDDETAHNCPNMHMEVTRCSMLRSSASLRLRPRMTATRFPGSCWTSRVFAAALAALSMVRVGSIIQSGVWKTWSDSALMGTRLGTRERPGHRCREDM